MMVYFVPISSTHTDPKSNAIIRKVENNGKNIKGSIQKHLAKEEKLKLFSRRLNVFFPDYLKQLRMMV